MMTDVVLQFMMISGAFIAGYGVCKLRHPAAKRDKRGRFTKK